jgi:hypothetical protein
MARAVEARMMDGSTVMLFITGVSLLLIGLAVPLIRGWVKPNHWYGLRIPATLNDPEIWYPANRYAGWLLLAYGLMLLIVAVGLPWLLGGGVDQAATESYGLGVAIAMLGGLAPVVFLSLRRAHKLERDRESENDKIS